MDLSALLLGVLWIQCQWTGLVEPAASFGLQGSGCNSRGGVDSTQSSQEQQRAQESQFELSCDVNTTARDLFLSDVRAQFGVTG